jgi:hypothetical protein
VGSSSLVSSSNDVLLHEIREIKEKVKSAAALTVLKESERKFWKELVDSNIRAGTIACLWCLKAQAIKRVCSAFNKWKFFAAVKNQEVIQVESHEQHKNKISTVIDNALSLIHKYKEDGIMTQINTSGNWKNTTQADPDLVFPWEERRNQHPPQSATATTTSSMNSSSLGISSSAMQYINQNISTSGQGHSHSHNNKHHNHHDPHNTTMDSISPPPPSHLQPPLSPKLHETMETTNKVWNFIQKEFHKKSKNENEILDPETERQLLCKLIFLLDFK